MSLGDITQQLKPWMRRTLVDDNPDSNNISVAERLTTQLVTFSKAVDSAGSDTADANFARPRGTAKILNVEFLPDAALTANDTNYKTISVWDGTTTYATVDTDTGGTGNWTDNTSVDVPVSTANVAANTGLRFRMQASGSGVIVPAGTLQVLLAERI